MRFSSASVLALSLLATPALANDNVMVVFDGSNSMWGQIDGTAKIEIARDVMGNLLGDWAEDRAVGLMAYGHRTRGDCTDIETIVQPGAAQRGAILDRIKSITPTGKTPLTDAVEQAAIQLSYTDQPATVVLISDGLESCQRDPCELARTLEQRGIDFTAHVVGFGLGGDEDTASLSCIASETGGQYIQASNATELGAAFSAVATAVATPVATPKPEPEPEPEPEAPKVTMTSPATALTGALFPVSWEGETNPQDYITIVPAGAEEGTFDNYIHMRDKNSGNLLASADPGLFEVRYIQKGTNATLASAPIELIKPEITLDGPNLAIAGALVDVAWESTVHPQDYITIVPVGADQEAFLSYQHTRDKSKVTLTMPADPGMYELRYVLNEGPRVLATQPIEVTEPEVTIAGPNLAVTGASVPITWTGTVNPQDYITIVPAGADQDAFGDYKHVRDHSQIALTMPADPGMYELRYVLNEGRRVLASQPIEVANPEVTLSGPATAATGALIPVTWTGTVNGSDYITIVPVGADDAAYGDYQQARDRSEVTLTAPADPGMYELRYVLNEGRKVMASAMIEITEPQVTISGPATAATGSDIKVSWTGTINAQDYLTVVPVGADDAAYGNYQQARDRSEVTLTMPADPGMYELRYVLNEGRKVMASTMIEITEPQVTITGPASAPTGSEVKVSWTGTINAQDYLTVVPVGADDAAYGSYQQARDRSEVTLTMPTNPGMYELRYVLDEGRKVMASAMIELTEPQVTIAGPDQIRSGDTIKVTWDGTVHRHDYITLVPMGAAEESYAEYFQVRDKAEGKLKAPAEVGMYELRYVLNEGKRVLARQTIEVLPEDAALNTGAALTAPTTGAPGSTIDVTWQVDSTSADQRITLAKGDQAIFTWISAVKITDGATSTQITLPSEAGSYELRFLDVSGQEVLARHVIKVE